MTKHREFDGGIYLDGVPNHFTESWWGMKTYSIFKMEYEIFLDYEKLSSALVPRIKNDVSPNRDDHGGFIPLSIMEIQTPRWDQKIFDSVSCD